MHQLLSKQANLIPLLLFVCSCPIVQANGFSFSTATDFTTGNYGGTKSTDIWYVPFTARYDKDRASFRVIVPYLNITGPGNVIGPGIGGIDSRGTIIGGIGNPIQGETLLFVMKRIMTMIVQVPGVVIIPVLAMNPMMILTSQSRIKRVCRA
ncbi:MAG: hypothetical protein H0X02_06960 [Nitrosomonas sp.]|nr:hypothetical protein [Nitrosomonas sp.]